jgi:DNA modification methylase
MKRKHDYLIRWIDQLSNRLDEVHDRDEERMRHGWKSEAVAEWKSVLTQIRADLVCDGWANSMYRHTSFIRTLDAFGVFDGPLFMELLKLGLELDGLD